MKRWIVLIAITMLLFGCSSEEKSKKATAETKTNGAVAQSKAKAEVSKKVLKNYVTKREPGVIPVTDANFEQEVINAEGVVVVDFWAAWCGPCKIIKPYLHELAVEYDGKVKIVSLDVDNNPKMASAFKINSIPAVYFFKDGELKDGSLGARPKSFYKQKISSLL